MRDPKHFGRKLAERMITRMRTKNIDPQQALRRVASELLAGQTQWFSQRASGAKMSPTGSARFRPLVHKGSRSTSWRRVEAQRECRTDDQCRPPMMIIACEQAGRVR